MIFRIALGSGRSDFIKQRRIALILTIEWVFKSFAKMLKIL